MAVVKPPCFPYQLRTEGKKKDFGLTPEEIHPLWRYARKRYLDNGVSYEDAIGRLATETGAPARFWEEVFDGGKTPAKWKTKEMFAAEDARRNAIWKAQTAIDRADHSEFYKVIRAVSELPRASLTAFHGGVFPVTHGGGLMLNPWAWRSFLIGAKESWRFAGGPGLPGALGRKAAMARYAKARADFVNMDRYADWRNVGLRIGVDERAQGILSGWVSQTPGWSTRAWLGLMRMRYEYAEEMLRHTPKFLLKTNADRIEAMRGIAEIANHATGVTNINFLGPIGRGAFAPQLTMSKVLRVTHDPAVTIQTFFKMMTGQKTTAGERVTALLRLRNATSFVAANMAGLYLNDQFLQQFGSNQRINWGLTREDRAKPDVWRYKLGDGTVLASRGPEEYMRLLGHVFAIPWETKREKFGKTGWFALMDELNRNMLFKLAPGPATAGELALGEDIMGRPLPRIYQQARGLIGIPELEGTEKRPQYTIPEYLWSHAPIFLDGPAREVYEDMRARGISQPDFKSLVHASLLTAMEFAGFGGYTETEQQPTPKPKGHTYKGAR